MVYDLLDGEVLDAQTGVVRMKGAQGTQEVLLSESDALWEELRHMHLEGAQRTVDIRVEEVKRRCEVKDASQMSTTDLLRLLRDSPEQKETIERLHLHLFIMSQLHR